MRLLTLLALATTSSAFAAVDHEAAFKADIIPLLEKSCANCHDPLKAKNGKIKSGFNSTTLKSVAKGGTDRGEGITWGDSSKSSLYRAVNIALTDPSHEDAMPLKKSYEKNPPLSKEQVAKIKAFIEAK